MDGAHRTADTRAALSGALTFLIFFLSMPAAGLSWRERLDHAEHISQDGREESAAEAQRVLAEAEKKLGTTAPEIGEILVRVSRIYEGAGEAARFPEMETRLRAFSARNFDVCFALGSLLRQDGKPLEAQEALKEALALRPDDPGAELELAGAYDDASLFEEEAAILTKLLEKKSGDYSLYADLARAYTLLGRSGQAEETYARAKRIAGLAADAYIDEGYFYLRSGEPVAAGKSFESAVSIDTASPFGYHHLGSYLVQTGQQYPRAEKYMRRALEMLEADPNASTHDRLHTMIWLGKSIAAQGRYAEAEAVYAKGLGIKQNDHDGLRWYLLQSLAAAYVSQGKNAQAEETYRLGIAECGGRFRCPYALAAEPWIAAGQFYLHQGRKAEAEAMAERADKACASIPIGTHELFDKLRDLSGLYAALGETSRNEALYARLLPLRREMPYNPDLVWVETGLAGMKASQGRFDEAEEHYRQAIDIMEHEGRWKEEAGLLDDLAGIYDRRGEPGAPAARERAESLRARP